MTYNVKFINENIYTDPNNLPKKKKMPLSMTTRRITVQVRGWEVDYNKYSRIPKSTFFTAVIRQMPKNLKSLNSEQLTTLFNRNVISPFVPITNWQEMKFFKDGRLWFKRNKVDMLNN